MNRREIFQAAGAVAAAALSTQALAQAKGHDHMGHQHHEHQHHGAGNTAVIHAAAHCLMAGQACIQHCLELLGKGDREMAACAMSVQQMLAVCETLQQLASYDSKHLGKMAKVALDICLDCETECRKHEKKHQACKTCADSCAACATECKKLGA